MLERWEYFEIILKIDRLKTQNSTAFVFLSNVFNFLYFSYVFILVDIYNEFFDKICLHEKTTKTKPKTKNMINHKSIQQS